MARSTLPFSACLGALFGCIADVRTTPLPPPAQPRPGHYVDVFGSPGAGGGPSDPWDLRTALRGGNGRVRPGDTIWVRGGEYRGAFLSTLAGGPGSRVVVRAWPGERAVLNGAGQPASSSTLSVRGEWSAFWGLEVTNTDPGRSAPRPTGVANYASHTAYVNLVVHDAGVGLYSEREAWDVEVYGCLIFNNGWTQPDRGHGHGAYVKSDVGPVVLRHNVMFNQFGYGVHAYSESGSGRLMRIRVEGNVLFDNGVLSRVASPTANVLAGGLERADSVVVSGNLSYYAPLVPGTGIRVGWDTLSNGVVTVERNYVVGGSPALDVGFWASAGVAENTVVGLDVVQVLRNPVTAGAQWSGNLYHRDPEAPAWELAGVRLPFAEWQAASGLGLSDVAVPGTPAAAVAFVLPNQYEPGRATVAVYNWGLMGAVDVDLAAVLAPGDSFEVRNVQALAAPVWRGVFGGSSVSLPLNGVAPPPAVGASLTGVPRTGPAFDVFLIRRLPPR
jgi:hypothetical protein